MDINLFKVNNSKDLARSVPVVFMTSILSLRSCIPIRKIAHTHTVVFNEFMAVAQNHK